MQRLSEDIEERFREHQKRMTQFKEKRHHDNLLKHEREHLKFEDQQ